MRAGAPLRHRDGRCERDLSRDLRGALTPRKTRHPAAVTPDELPALLRAIDGFAELGDKVTALALRLLALLFVRTGELVNATRDEIDLNGVMWIVPAKRMEMKTQHVVPLSRPAAETLRELQSVGGESRYVFPGRNIDKQISNTASVAEGATFSRVETSTSKSPTRRST